MIRALLAVLGILALAAVGCWAVLPERGRDILRRSFAELRAGQERRVLAKYGCQAP